VTTLEIEVTDLTFSQSDWHKVGSVNGRSANRRLRNWSSKVCGRTEKELIND